MKPLLLFGVVAILFTWVSPNTLADNSGTAQSAPLSDQQAQLEQQLQQIQNQINQLQQQLNQIGAQKNTLNNKIKQLQAQKNQVALQIQQTNLNLQNLGVQIGQTQSQINADQNHLDVLHQEISALLVRLYESDHQPTFELFLSSSGFGDFYNQLTDYQQLNQNVSDLAAQLELEAKKLQGDKDQLSSQQDQQQNFLQVQTLQNQKLAQNIQDQNDLLNQTKGKESNYQAQLQASKQQADQIKARIYELFGGGSNNITFGQAVQIAKYASGLTGVRPAFLLAILTQESNLGKNIGTCNRPGDPPNKSWKVIMKPDRDQKPFVAITGALGLDPDVTPVSCPMHDKNGNQIGWGGAMGPAQFIPSTWVGYQAKVATITGQPANPFDIRDAFLAAAIKLAGQGATSQSGEWAAAMRYFSGGTNPAFSFYGDSVLSIATKYQTDIDQLGNN